MKNLTITIRAELEIPDDWELVEHPSGAQVLKVGGDFVDFDIAPLSSKSEDPETEWSDHDVVLVESVLDCVVGLEAELDIGSTQ